MTPRGFITDLKLQRIINQRCQQINESTCGNLRKYRYQKLEADLGGIAGMVQTPIYITAPTLLALPRSLWSGRSRCYLEEATLFLSLHA